MPTSTHSIPVNAADYANVSNGNVNCTLIVATGASLRVVIGGTQPAADTTDYVSVRGPGTSSPTAHAVSVENLEAEDDMWVRAEQHDTTIKVVRGPAVVRVS